MTDEKTSDAEPAEEPAVTEKIEDDESDEAKAAATHYCPSCGAKYTGPGECIAAHGSEPSTLQPIKS
jgi:hypothetical protein